MTSDEARQALQGAGQGDERAAGGTGQGHRGQDDRKKTEVIIGGTVLCLSDDRVTITLPDGSSVDAVPHDTRTYQDTAERNGYGADTLKLCQDHEVTHVALCHWLGLDVSPTLARVSDGDTSPSVVNGLEEDAVLAVQRFARAVGVDLVQRMRDQYDERPRVQGVV